MNKTNIRRSIKSINLVDSYMNPAELRFFTTSNEPNGTAHLIVVDNDGQVVDFLDNFLFDPINDHDRNGETFGGVFICPYGESVWLAEGEDTEDISEDMIVYPLLFSDVLNSVAVSPVHSHIGQLKTLISTIKKAV